MVKFLLAVIFLFPLTVSAQTDTTIGITAPKDQCGDYKDLAHYLCDAEATEQAKANAIYNWITHNIKYDVVALKKGKPDKDKKAEKALKNRKAVCEGYAMLFTGMCREAGLKAVNIEGYAKDWIFDNGDKLYIPRHEWSAVMINGQWQLVDPTWGAGDLVQEPNKFVKIVNKILHHHTWSAKNLKFRFRYDPQYFMQDPLAFRLKHIPTDPIWQLTDSLMPMRVFEAGDSAITAYNKQYPKLNQSDPEFLRISDLDEKQKLFEYADRAYTYNNRFPVVLAIKQIYKATSEVEEAFTDSTIQTGLLLITDAQKALKRSQDYIKEQKKSFPGQYSDLKKKNKTKNQEANKYIQAIKADDKRNIAQCTKYSNSAKNKFSKIKRKRDDANKRKQGLSPQKIDNIDAAKTQKKSTAPELVALTDSFETRKLRLAGIQKRVDSIDILIQTKQAQNRTRLDSLGQDIILADSALIQETISRINMHDNYDDEVILWSARFKDLKYHKADTLQKYYLTGYDSVVTLIEERQKTHITQLDIYKKNLRTLEQYHKWNSNDTTFTGQYADWVKLYQDGIATYNSNMVAYNDYVKSNKKLFAGLAKINKKEIKIAEYMNTAEQMRKKLEEKTLVKKQVFDNHENDKQSVAVKDLLKQLDKISSKAN